MVKRVGSVRKVSLPLASKSFLILPWCELATLTVHLHIVPFSGVFIMRLEINVLTVVFFSL